MTMLCVLIWSLQDGAGPTVSQQIGASMNNSPFGSVLKNIKVHTCAFPRFHLPFLCCQEQADEAGWWWWPRGTLHLLPGGEGRNSPKSLRGRFTSNESVLKFRVVRCFNSAA